MKKISNVFYMVLATLAVILVIGCIGKYLFNNETDDENISSNDAPKQNEIVSDEIEVDEKDTPIKNEKLTEWKGHKLGKYKFVLTNDEYAVVVKKIDKVKDTIRLTYTFINESEDDSSAIWNFQCTPYQNGTNLSDNDKYEGHYYKCKNEQTSVRSGYSIDDCWELIPIGDRSEIECDMGAGMWNETHLLKINPETMKWTVEEK